MIQVSQDQLEQVQYLIKQSSQGNHVLFDQNLIREAFQVIEPLDDDDELELDEITEKHIEQIIAQPTLRRKRAYLDRLNRPELLKVVQVYFNIVENDIFEKKGVTH